MTDQVDDRKQSIYNFIDSFTKENHYPPTIREIGDAIGVHSTSMILFYLNQLIDDGKIDRKEGISRGIWIIR